MWFKRKKQVLNEIRKDFIRVCQVIDSCQTQLQLNHADNMITYFKDKYKEYKDECFDISHEVHIRYCLLNDLWLKTSHRLS